MFHSNGSIELMQKNYPVIWGETPTKKNISYKEDVNIRSSISCCVPVVSACAVILFLARPLNAWETSVSGIFCRRKRKQQNFRFENIEYKEKETEKWVKIVQSIAMVRCMYRNHRRTPPQDRKITNNSNRPQQDHRQLRQRPQHHNSSSSKWRRWRRWRRRRRNRINDLPTTLLYADWIWIRALNLIDLLVCNKTISLLARHIRVHTLYTYFCFTTFHFAQRLLLLFRFILFIYLFVIIIFSSLHLYSRLVIKYLSTQRTKQETNTNTHSLLQ